MLGVVGDAFEVVLEIDDRYRILLTFPWDGDPHRLARDASATLAGPAWQRWDL